MVVKRRLGDLLASFASAGQPVDTDDVAINIPAMPTSTAAQPAPWRHSLHHRPPLIYAHRGDPTLHPENTIASYRAAILAGADHIEPDLVLTKDHGIVCFHGLELSHATNIADLDVFANRKRSMTVRVPGGYAAYGARDGWWIEDFTLEEIKSLRVRGTKNRQGMYTGAEEDLSAYAIPTFGEFLDLVNSMSQNLARPVGIILDVKAAHHHNSHESRSGASEFFFEDLIIDELTRADLLQSSHALPPAHSSTPRIIIESLERPCLTYLRSKIPPNPDHIQLSLLVGRHWQHATPADMLLTKSLGIERLCFVKYYFHVPLPAWLRYMGLGIIIKLAMRLAGFAGSGDGLQLVRHAHDQCGLYVDAFTYQYSDATPWSSGVSRWMDGELGWAMRDLGLDGVFVEGVSEAKRIRDDASIPREDMDKTHKD